MTCLRTTSLGAYVLGALEPAERHATEAHLADCSACRRELVRLTPLPGLLGLVSFDELGLPAGDVPEKTPPSRAVAPPRPRRWAHLPVAAALVGVVAIGGLAFGSLDDDDGAAVTWSAEAGGAGPAIDATARLSPRAWGTDVELTLDDLPTGLRCRLDVVSDDGRVETAGWWTTGYSSSVTVPASTSVRLAEIDSMEIRAGDQVLAVLEPELSGP
jgi:hypothetical protein